MNPKVVDRYLEKATKWKDEMTFLRNICRDSELTEDFKWMHPCYTYKGSNIVLIHGFKDYCALLFHKGALLKDEGNILIQQTKNVQSARQLRFTSLYEIKNLEVTIKAYIFEATKIKKAGLKVTLKKTSEFVMPDEFKMKLDDSADLKSAFEGLTPGRQRGYLLHFSGAKQSKTRKARVEKHIPRILDGKGLNDS